MAAERMCDPLNEGAIGGRKLARPSIFRAAGWLCLAALTLLFWTMPSAAAQDVGGTWQGVGWEDRYLLVSEAQYKALVEAKVVPAEDGAKGPTRGKNSRKRAEP